MNNVSLNEEFFLDVFHRNLKALEIFFPQLFERFKEYKEERYHFVFDAEGAFNIYDEQKERNVYIDQTPIEFCANSLAEYKKAPVYHSILFSMPSELPSKVNPVHANAINKLAKLKYFQSRMAAFGNGVQFSERIPSILITSVGIGFDIEHIFLNHDVVNAIVVEPDSDIFFASLFVCRWYEIFEKQEENGFSLSLYVGFNEADILGLFHHHFYGVGRHKNNGLFLYSPIDLEEESYLKTVADYVNSALLDGFGFYDDSLYSLSASLVNAENKVPLYVNSDSIDLVDDKYHGVPVFIVGAGPSLDNDLPYIKKYEKKVLIISCGSGIKSLESYGIVPDIHVECERTAITKHWLEQVDENYLKSVAFVGLNVIYPELFKLFRRSGSMAKAKETGTMLMAKVLSDLRGKDYLPMFSFLNPTVTHMGVGVAPFLGFRSFYIFGTDMGYKSAENHHSKSSSYNDVTDEYKKALIPEESFPVQSNFEESDILTDKTYVSFRMHLENELRVLKGYFGKIEHFNCSDGAFISGCEPLRASALEFLDDYKVLDKKEIVDDVFDRCFESQDGLGDRMHSELADKIPLVKKVCLDMSKRLRADVKTIQEYELLMDSNINYLFYDQSVFSEKDGYLLSLFSGSLLYYFSVLNSVAYSPGFDEEKNIEFVKKALIHIAEFFEEVESSFEDNYMKIDDVNLYNYFG